MGDIDYIGFKVVFPMKVEKFCIGNPNGRHPVVNFLREADIVTVPHHGLLSHSEGCVCSSLLMNRQDRVFLVSGNPYDASFPLLSDVSVYLKQASLLEWKHRLSLRNIYLSHENVEFVSKYQSLETNIPLFSTYYAPHGFIWTRITPDGTVSIHNGTCFRRVLPR